MKRLHVGVQFSVYLIVGGLSFFVDIGGFVVLTALTVPILLAAGCSFILATAANYLLSYKLAFSRGCFGRGHEIGRLFAVALLGLGLNTLLVWLLITYTPTAPLVAKILVVPVVLIWNFLGRRLFVFDRTPPEASIGAAQAVLSAVGYLRDRPTFSRSIQADRTLRSGRQSTFFRLP